MAVVKSCEYRDCGARGPMQTLTEAREGRKAVLEIGALQIGNKATVLDSEGCTLAADVTIQRDHRQHELCYLADHVLYVHEEDAANAAVDLNGGDTVDEGGDEVAAATGDTTDVQVAGAATLVSVGPDGTDVEVLRSRL